LFAVKLVDDVLNAHPAHADARADGINAFLPGRNGHLGAEAGLSGDRLDLDGAGEDLGHLLFEQTPQHEAVCTRNDDLWPTRRIAHLGHIHPEALTLIVALSRNLLRARHNRFGTIDLDDHRAR